MSYTYRINRSNKRGRFSKELPSGNKYYYLWIMDYERIKMKIKKTREVKENVRKKFSTVVSHVHHSTTKRNEDSEAPKTVSQSKSPPFSS